MKTLRRNERHDTDRAEAKLISVGHHLIRFARLKGLMVSERSLFWEAAEIVWQAKREYRVELKARRAARAVTTRATFAKLRPAASVPQPRNAWEQVGARHVGTVKRRQTLQAKRAQFARKFLEAHEEAVEMEKCREDR